MGIYDRDYYREPARGNAFGMINGWSVTTWLIAINAVVFVADQILGRQLSVLGALSIDTDLQIWRFLTLQFLHVDIPHIFFNMLALYFFGPIVERMLGSRRYLAFYLLCGIASGVSYVILWYPGVLQGPSNTMVLGASGSIFGVLVAAAVIAPNMIIRIDFIFPIKLRTLAMVMVGFGLFQIIRSGRTAGSEAGHIGGALLGFLLIRNPRLLNFADYRRPPRMRYRP